MGSDHAMMGSYPLGTIARDSYYSLYGFVIMMMNVLLNDCSNCLTLDAVLIPEFFPYVVAVPSKNNEVKIAVSL